MVGPILGANPIAMPEMPITVACLSRGNEVITMLIIMGMVMPAETAWSTRPQIRTSNDGATASMAAPSNRSSNAANTTFFSGKRRIR